MDYCTQKAGKECQVAVKCGTVMDACVTQRTTACLAVNAASKTAPRSFQAGNVAACVNKTNSVYANALTSEATPTDLADMDDVCAYVFQGNSATACKVKYDCMDSSKICDKGLCAKKVVKNKGDFCTDPGAVCATGSYCATDPVTSTLTCLAKAAQNAACSATVPCVETLRCDGATGTCLPLFTGGQLCGSSDDCVTTAPFCDQYIGCKCDLGLSFAAGASACVDYGGGPSGVITPACGAGSSPDAGTISTTDASSGG